MEKNTVRLSMNVPERLMSQIDELSSSLCLTRTATITMILATYFEQKEAMSKFNQLGDLARALESAQKNMSLPD